jgi:hypothetical protein
VNDCSHRDRYQEQKRAFGKLQVRKVDPVPALRLGCFKVMSAIPAYMKLRG